VADLAAFTMSTIVPPACDKQPGRLVRDPVLGCRDGDAAAFPTGEDSAQPTFAAVQREPNAPVMLGQIRQVTLPLVAHSLERVVVDQAHFSLLVSS